MFIFLQIPNILAYSEKYRIVIWWKETTYEDVFDGTFQQNTGISIDIISSTMINEFVNILKRTKDTYSKVTPEKRIERFKLQSQLTSLASNVYFFWSDFMLLHSKDLRSIGYPIADDEFKSWIANYTDFRREIMPEDLIKLVKEYPNTEYEKEALYLIATETDFEVPLWMMWDVSYLKWITYKIQSSKMFLEKYKDDVRANEIQKIFDKMKSKYNSVVTDEKPYDRETPENAYLDRGIEKSYKYNLANWKYCNWDEITNWCKDGFNQVEVPIIKKIPLEKVLKSELWYIEYEDIKDKQKKNIEEQLEKNIENNQTWTSSENNEPKNIEVSQTWTIFETELSWSLEEQETLTWNIIENNNNWQISKDLENQENQTKIFIIVFSIIMTLLWIYFVSKRWGE